MCLKPENCMFYYIHTPSLLSPHHMRSYVCYSCATAAGYIKLLAYQHQIPVQKTFKDAVHV